VLRGLQAGTCRHPHYSSLFEPTAHALGNTVSLVSSKVLILLLSWGCTTPSWAP
jgi:hypothetical protein